MQVLIVDDSDLDRERIRRQLKKHYSEEHSIQEGDSGQQGLELMKEAQFDCVLLDYRLPDMTGLEVMEQAKKLGIEHPVFILLTGAGDPQIDQSAEKLGAFDYLVKDQIDPQSLERSIRYSVKIKQQLDQLKLANKVKDDFMAAVSHEMRTPLNAVINYSDHLKNGVYGPLNEGHEKIISRIHQVGLHLSTLVESILTTMTLQQEVLELDLEPVQLDEEIQFSVDIVKELAEKKSLQIAMQIAPNLQVLGDRSKLRQILINLIGNAIKFTEEGGITIQASHCDGEAHIRISDTGIGIPEDKLESIFEAFVQVEGTLSRRYGGLGLGLTISKKLTELHKGRLLIESEPQQGTHVTICLPLNE